MSFFISRDLAKKRGQDRADIFARGEAAVLVVADGAGGLGDGGAAAERVMEIMRDAVLDPAFDLLAPPRWIELLRGADEEITQHGESTVVVVVLVPGMLVHASAGDSEAWIVREHEIERLTKTTARLGSGKAGVTAAARRELDGRLIVASDGLFRNVLPRAIAEAVRDSRFNEIGQTLITRVGTPIPDDVSVLVAENA